MVPFDNNRIALDCSKEFAGTSSPGSPKNQIKPGLRELTGTVASRQDLVSTGIPIYQGILEYMTGTAEFEHTFSKSKPAVRRLTIPIGKGDDTRRDGGAVVLDEIELPIDLGNGRSQTGAGGYCKDGNKGKASGRKEASPCYGDCRATQFAVHLAGRLHVALAQTSIVTSKSRYLIHLTAEERNLLLDFVEPAGAFDEFLLPACVTGQLVVLDLDASELETFLQLVDGTGRHAQNMEVGDRLMQVHERLESGIAGSVDPGAHLLRPGAAAVGFTPRQGQYLAFIHCYQQLHGRAPAESELQAYFRVSPPAVHEMLKTLQRRRYIAREPGKARSIKLWLRPEQIPALEALNGPDAV